MKMTNSRRFQRLLDDGLKTEAGRNGYEEGQLSVMLGAWFLTLREHMGLTQKQVALAAKISQGDIARLEAGRGRRGPTIGTLERVARAQGYVITLRATPLAEMRKAKRKSRADELTLAALLPRAR